MRSPGRSVIDRSNLERYARQMVLPQVGPEGQERLRAASVAVVGAGGLGAPVLAYLAAAGVGRIGIIDFDRVETTNLHRQVLFADRDVGRPKVDVAAERLQALAPGVRLDLRANRLDAGNARTLLEAFDVVVDGSDRIETRYAVNDACLALGVPFVYGSVYRFEGQVSVFAAPDGPCFRCLLPDPPDAGAVPDCAEGGVLGAVPATIGSLQASEALKLVLGAGDPLVGRLLVFDALAASWTEFRVPRRQGCPGCERSRTARRSADVSPGPARIGEIGVHALAARLRDGDDAPVLLDVRTAAEREIGTIPGDLWIPMHEIEARAASLDPARETVVYCHVGSRSAMICRYLAGRHGFSRVLNLAGGIDAWSREIDPSVPRYGSGGGASI